MDCFEVYTDGAARGNPGQSASGFSIYKNDILIKKFLKFNNIKTNNYAEYNAIILALVWCSKNLRQEDTIKFYSDSELVVNQINQRFKIKAKHLIKLFNRVNELKKHFENISFIHVNRANQKISLVDKSLNQFLDRIARKQNQIN
ncbi:MAG: ribonuclease HI family protein [Candidatus Marsarchaeota archaeon]|nr:ribonuclease HI family protein [Candidatus Marsarchaeota archaeon]MCL5094845.1 ribonuclease HI family protein [Candidatus Marsarchaeota archaeon]